MKKILALVLALIMIFATVACDKGNNQESGTKESTASSEQPSENPSEKPSEKPTESTPDATEATEGNSETTPETEKSSDTEGGSDTESNTEDNTESDTEKDTGKDTETETDTETENKKVNYATEYPYVDRDGIIHITFQDTYDFGKAIAEIKDQDVTSYKTGTSEKDDAVLTIKGNAVYASGCGMATVVLEDGSEECVIVHASPINLFFLTGQSNGAGDPPSASAFVKGEYQQYFAKSPETMAYYTWTAQGLTIYNASDFVTRTLEWNNMGVKNGCEPYVLTKENYTGGFANFSVCAGFAHEWVKQTGERIWIVNASHGGQPIHCFKPSEDGEVVDNDYYQAITVFNLALETLYREVDAGHFTLHHMAYYWFQGEGDSTNTFDYYYDAFAEMHEALQKDVVYDHNGKVKTLEYCGIFTIRSSTNNVSELFLTGPRLAQYTAANQLQGIYKNVFLATKATENWIISDENVKNYFLDVYGSNEAFKAEFGYDIPDTLKTVHPEIHYRIFGQNEMGVDAARNTLKFLNYFNRDDSFRLDYASDGDVALKLVALDGYYDLGDTLYFDAGRMDTHVVPYITPVWRTVEGLSLKVLTEGFEVEGFRIISHNQSAKEITVEIYLGKQLLDTRTFKIKYSSSLANNAPLVINFGTALYPDRRFGGYQPGWDAGFLHFTTGEFDVYTAVHKDGWIYDGKDLWSATNGGGHGGILVSGSVKLGPTNIYDSEGALGIRYTSGKTGKVKLSVTSFNANIADCYIAVFVNGEKVWPVNDAPEDNRNGWYLAEKSATVDTINALWADLVLDINAEDEIVFAVSRLNSNPQAIIYPSVEYVD